MATDAHDDSHHEPQTFVEKYVWSQDHKVIAVATEDPEFNSYREAREMPQHRLLMLRRFFQDYKQLEGKAVEVDEIRPAAEAYPIIEHALARYSEQRRRGFQEV